MPANSPTSKNHAAATPKWLPKFECKSTRVKGLSFHPTRSWVAASMHNGSVQIWDYKLGVRVDMYEVHDGPVRCVCFHPTQALIASAGDDHRIKLWDYKLRKCVCTFDGHSDYVRSVAFHHDSPWIISASDDQTARIWNWQSRSCIAVITGHTHYVMCAAFHPSQNLIATCSLDQTVRIWDMSGLCRKHSAAGRGFSIDQVGSFGGPAQSTDKINPDYYGPFDVVSKHVLEGHDRGVNWVSFHPTKPLFVSCSDDRLVKVWRMNESQAWELESFRSHSNNVSCATFLPTNDWIISCSEDRTVKVWDLNKKTLLFTQKKEGDRFWALSVHPTNDNLIATGFDSGFVVFKLQSERPAVQHQFDDGSFYYEKDGNLRLFSLLNGQPKETIIASIANCKGQIQSIDVSTELKAVLLSYWNSHDSVDLMFFGRGSQTSNPKLSFSRALFIGNSLIAAYNSSSNAFSIVDTNGNVQKEFTNLPFSIKSIHLSSFDDCLLIVSNGKLINFNISTGKVRNEVEINQNSSIKRIFWNSQKTHFCVALKKSILIFDSSFGMSVSSSESVPIKSCIWNESGNVVYYSTCQHLKFILLNGDCGILNSTLSTEYLGACFPGRLFVLDKKRNLSVHNFEYSEIDLKLALEEKNFAKVHAIINDCNLVGESIIAYLRKKGFSQIALSFVKEPASRFELAIECSDLSSAMDSCNELNSNQAWETLAEEASKQGRTDKLEKLAKICKSQDDFSSGFLCDLYLGRSEPIANLFHQAKLSPLAYLASKSCGFNEKASEFLSQTGINPDEIEEFPVMNEERSSCLREPTAGSQWVINKPTSIINELFKNDQQKNELSNGSFDEIDNEESEFADTSFTLTSNNVNYPNEPETSAWDDDLKIETLDDSSDEAMQNHDSFILALKKGLSMSQIDSILSSQYGIKNIEPISDLIHFYSESENLPLSIHEIQSKVKHSFSFTTNGKFSESLKEFKNALYLVPFTEESSQLDELKSICSNYILGLQMELLRKDQKTSPTQSLQLAILFTLCKLQDEHLVLALRSAMSVLYKAKNFKTCISIAKRLLSMSVDDAISNQTKKIISLCEKSPSDSIPVGDDFESLDGIVAICSKSFVPLSSSQLAHTVQCHFCGAVACNQFQDDLCNICELNCYE